MGFIKFFWILGKYVLSQKSEIKAEVFDIPTGKDSRQSSKLSKDGVWLS